VQLAVGELHCLLGIEGRTGPVAEALEQRGQLRTHFAGGEHVVRVEWHIKKGSWRQPRRSRGRALTSIPSFRPGHSVEVGCMEQHEMLARVRDLRAQRFTPAEIARAVGISKADAARLVRVVACERASPATATVPGNASNHRAVSQARCWVSPGWRHRLQIDGHADWPDDAGAPTEASDSGVACVLIATPERPDKLAVCGYLVDTWCLGVKNAIGPRRMGGRELEAFKREYFGPWETEGIPVPLELAQHLVLGAVDFARSLGFEPHPDFRRARRALGSWEGPSAITFGINGKPLYVNGPHEDPQRVLATLERTVGRDGFHYSVSLGQADGLSDGYRYTATLTDLDELGDAA